MKKLVLFAAAAMFAISGGNLATAAPFATFPTAGASSASSSLGITISALGGFLNVPLGPTSITGTADAAISLDGSDSGSVEIFSSQFNLADFAGSAATPLGVVNYTFAGVGFEVILDTTATGGAFQINSGTTGGLNLNQGVITLTGAIPATLNLNTDPINSPFSGLGATTLAGTTNDDLTGNDTTDIGDEINIVWPTGVFTQVVITDPVTLTLDIFLTGSGLSIGRTDSTPPVVPEPTSGLFLASLAVGACGVVRRRRK